MKKHQSQSKTSSSVRNEKKVNHLYPMNGWKADLLVFLGFYAAMAILYYPLFFLNQILTLSPDSIAAESLYRTAQLVLKQSDLPLWNPYIFSGMPLFSAYQFGLFVNPIWYLSKLVSFLFGGGYAVIFVYMWLGAIGIYTVVRELGERKSLGFIAGLIWLWLPSLIVLPDVGHGSKLMSSAMLPWILWGSLKVVRSSDWTYVGVLAIILGLSILSLHTQITYYGFMLLGWVTLWYLGFTLYDKRYKETFFLALKILLAGLIGVGISMVLSLPVLDFASVSSRGAATGGGVDWEYATNWSFHPKETITFLWPTFYGFGGYTYWGHMPFTDMALTFGIVALVGSILAIVFQRDRITWMLFGLAIVAWVISFGKFFPILFKPLFEYLPMFNKFRVPSLILILTQLSMIVLSARGYGAVLKLAEQSSPAITKTFQRLVIGGGILLGLFIVLSFMMSNDIQTAYVEKMSSQVKDAGALEQLSKEMWSFVFIGGLRSFLLLALIVFFLWLFVKNTITRRLLFLILIIAVVVDFFPLIHNKVRPLIGFISSSELDNYFSPTKRVQYLLKQSGHFRVLPTDRNRSINWWSSHGIQNASGYSGVKLGNWDALEKHSAFRNPSVWSALNIEYVTSERPIPSPWLSEVARDQEGYLYKMSDVMPRAYFGKRTITVPNRSAAYDTMATPTWHPREVTIIEGKNILQDEDTTASVEMVEWKPDYIKMKASRNSPGVLVLSEIMAPHWIVLVNGKPAEALTVNGLLRGVLVPEGKSKIEWQYEEYKVFYKGLWLTVISSLLSVVIIVLGIFWKRKSKQPL
ncbi:MAG: hypothetical protein N2450_06145 [bacterium]|nr:hypothetical protein [bacterium]